MLELNDNQIKAINKLDNGKILCGDTGSGKSRTALVYYYTKVGKGKLRINKKGEWDRMKNPKNLYIITTPKKRDSLEWEKEIAELGFGGDIEEAKFKIDSWNNIKKYTDIKNSFFIFDEQRLVGDGVWVKSFYKIASKNKWILLSATPGDTWSDYIPVFVANGYYKNKTDFQRKHCVFSRYSKFPKVERYIAEQHLEKLRNDILVDLPDNRKTIPVEETIFVDYDKDTYHKVFRERWDPYNKCPIKETGKLFYLIRRVVNENHERIKAVDDILKEHPRVIIFYNFTYELNMLREYLDNIGYLYGEWNGEKHEDLPKGHKWVYLVQYSAGAEGWNCITTDTMIFFSLNYSYRISKQARGRIDRINTRYKYLYYYEIKTKSSIDLAISRALGQKKNFNERNFYKKGYNGI